MKILGYLLSSLFLALAMAVIATPASAQATRTWVSGVGDDANPCSRTAPCKTFAGAISKTAPGGEINVLDPGGFGGVTITKSITIRSDYFEAGVLVSGTNGIIISAGPTDNVTLEGLDIEGLTTGLDGVKILSAKTVYIVRCAIRHFATNGVEMVSSSSGARVFIKDSLITLNGTNAAANSGGVRVQGNGVGNVASILNSTLDGNANFAVQANGAGNVIGASNSTFSGSPTAISVLSGATATSFGPSNVVSGAGSFTTTNPFQ